MDCAEFESRLTELLSGDWDADGRQPKLVERLMSHAEQCEGCRGALDLLELAAEPAERRDWNAPPDAGYGERFEQRLRSRIDSASGPAAGRGRLGRWGWIAAALLLAAAGWAVLAPSTNEPVRVAIDGDPAPDPVPDWDDLDPALLDEAAAFGLWGEPVADDGWIYPALEELEPDTTDGLLEWLRRQNDELRGVKS